MSIMADKLRFGTDYNDVFEPKSYINMHYDVTTLSHGFNRVYLNNFVNFWLDSFRKGDISGDSLLDLSTGPNIIPTACASRRFQRIYWSEFSSANREALTAWRLHKEDAYDWSPFFEYLVAKETSDDDNEKFSSASTVETRLRHAVQDVLMCDLLQDPPILSITPVTSFDCVITSGALESACSNREAYSKSVAAIGRLIKPGGVVLVHGFINENYYTVGTEKFWVLPLDVPFVRQAFTAAGFTDIQIADYPNENTDLYDAGGYFFLRAAMP